MSRPSGVPVPVACVRCGVAAAHPGAQLPERCPNCGRLRGDLVAGG